MSTKKQKERKKKQRELKAKARVLARARVLSAQKKQEKQAKKLENKFREKAKPIIKDPDKKAKMEEVENQKRLKKLQKNLEVLKALEDEYQKEVDLKNKINQELEAEGHITLPEKFKALEERAKDSMNESEKESGQIDLESKTNEVKNSDS